MSDPHPEFQLRLPDGGPIARGRLLDEKGVNGSQKFVVLAGSPIRRDVVPSFEKRAASAHKFRQKLIDDGLIAESAALPDYLEATEDLPCGSPSSAAAIVLGRNPSAWTDWKSDNGHPLGDFVDQAGWGPSRTWLVRGPHLAGIDTVKDLWLSGGWVSLAVERLREGIEPGMSKNRIRSLVEENYESATHTQRVRLVDDFHFFLSRMKLGDTVCTTSNGLLYIGEITSTVERFVSEGGRSYLRRPVEWQSIGYPYDELPDELHQSLSSQHVVVDITSLQALVAGLGRSDEELADAVRDAEGDPSVEIAALAARREVELPEPTEELAEKLLAHDVEWLREVRDLLLDEQQLIFYGPPGTGKTYLALELAKFFGGGPEQVKLVQFHPSYAYMKTSSRVSALKRIRRPGRSLSGSPQVRCVNSPTSHPARATGTSHTSFSSMRSTEPTWPRSSASCTSCWNIANSRYGSPTRATISRCRGTCSSSAP